MTIQSLGYLHQAEEERGLKRENNIPEEWPALSFPNMTYVIPCTSVSQG